MAQARGIEDTASTTSMRLRVRASG